MPPRTPGSTGFTLLPVVLAMSLVAAIAFLLNRDNGVNANLIGARSDRERARYAAEAGLQAANYKIQSLGCAGVYPISNSPVTDSNFGGAAYSAYANNTTGSPLLLTSIGTYNGASVTLTRSSVYVYQSGSKSFTVQPPTGTGQDTHVNSGLLTANYGASTTLKLKASNFEPLLKFDLSAFAPGSRAIPWYDGSMLQPGAQLALWQTNTPTASNGAIAAYMVTHSWVAGTRNGSGIADGATWNSYEGVNAWPPPGVEYDTKQLAVNAFVNVPGWYYWDITDAVVAWQGSVYPNYGVRMNTTVGLGTGILYASNDDAVNVTWHPKLIMNYLLPCGATAPA